MSNPVRRPARTLLASLLCLGLAVPPPLWAQSAPGPAGAAGGTPAGGHSPALRSRTPVTVNFVNADIEAVTRAFAAMIQRQISVDPRVKGTITVYSEQPLSIREAYLTYQSALRGMGFAMVETGGLLKVVPEADAKLQTGTVSVGAVQVRGDQILTQIFNLRYENANNLVTVLRPLISANNTINASPGSNALVITDYADNLQRIAQMIAELDKPSQTDFEVVPLKHALASDLAPVLQRMADAGGGGGAAVPGGVPGMASAGASVTAFPASNALIIRAPNAARHASLKESIEKLDRPPSGAGPAGNLWVVYLKNADAARLATVLRAAFPSSGAGSGSGGASGAVAAPAPAAQPGGGGAGSPQATAPITGAAAPSTGGFVQADPATNSLIITAAEPLYRQVRALIDQLDTRRAQVYIESMIVEVSGDNAADFGFQWQGILGNRGDSNLVAAGTNFGSGGSNIISLQTGAASGTVTLPQGLNIGLIRNFGGTYALAGIARALQSQTATNIISTPNQITLDNEEAKIVVGSNVPFITGQYTGGSGSGTSNLNPFQTIERKDVGLTLRVRPQVGEGGTVRMSIYLESSSVSDKVAPGTSNAGPSTNKRQIESNVVVDDGGIIVLGGLIEDRFTESRSKVPLLGDLPYVGGLFRSESRTKTRTNLMVFLRPVVLRDAASGDRLSLDRYELMRAQQQGSQPAPNPMLPLGEAPVLPPLGPAAPGTRP